MKKALLLLVCLILGSLGLWAQAGDGYFAWGTAEASSLDEAISLAKSDALSNAFENLKKDQLFQNLYYDNLTVYARTDFSEPEEESLLMGGFKVRIQVTLDPVALSLIQQSYEETVIGILNQAESTLLSIEESLDRAESQLAQSQVTDAYQSYQTVVSLSDSVLESLDPIGDARVRSDSGDNKEVILSRVNLRRSTAEDGLVRLREIEEQSSINAAQQELSQTFQSVVSRQDQTGNYLSMRFSQAPFFDWPREELETILVEVRTRKSTLQDIRDELSRIRELTGESSVLFQSRVNQALTSNEELRQMADKIIGDLDREINDPRIQRVERERMAAQAREAVVQWFSDGLNFLFTRAGTETLNLRFNYPMSFINGDFNWYQWDDARIRLEVAYQGVWILQDNHYKRWALSNGDFQNNLQGTLGLGFGEDGFIGGGVVWDWFNSTGIAGEIPRSFGIKFFMGAMDGQYNWPLWLLSLQWQNPVDWWPLNLAYVMNLAGDIVFRPGDFLKLSGGFRANGFLRETPPDDTADVLDYRFYYFGEVAIKPGPFILGVTFESDSFNAWDSDQIIQEYRWRFFSGYSF